MRSLRLTTLAAASLLLFAATAPAQSAQGRFHRWSVSYGLGTVHSRGAERDLNAGLAAAGFNLWSSREELGCIFIVCWTSTIEGPSDSKSRGRARSVTVGYTFNSGLELRAEGATATTGWAFGARAGFDGALFEHDVASLSTLALAKVRIFRLGIGPELTRVSMNAQGLSDAEWTARTWNQILTDADRSSGEKLSVRSTRLGAVTSASVQIGGRVYFEFGVQYHIAPSITAPALRVNGIYTDSAARIPSSRVSLNRAVMLFSLGLRP